MELILQQELLSPITTSTPHGKRTTTYAGFHCHILQEYGRELYVFAGNQKGDVVYWKWDPEQTQNINFTKIGSHNGSVLCILYHPVHQLLFTGSTDHALKIWDPFGIYLQENSCLQTIFGHDQPIFTLAYHYDLLLSGGADQAVRIWKPDAARKLYKLHPWFQQLKAIGDFDSWVTSMWTSPMALSGEQGELVVGDMNGNISVYKSIGLRSERNEIVDFRRLSKERTRKLGITHIIMLYGNNLMITAGYDNQVKFSDSAGVNNYSSIKRAGRIAGITWIPQQEEMVMVDVSGKIDIYQYRKGKINYTGAVSPDCTSISLHPNGEYLFCGTKRSIDVFKIDRHIPYQEHNKHTEPIIGLHLDERFPVDRRLVSAACDNKICLWHVDRFDMNCKSYWQEEESEIASSLRLDDHAKIHLVTGHDNGNLCFWNFDTGLICRLPVHSNTASCIVLTTFDNTVVDIPIDIHIPQKGLNSKYYIVSGCFDGSLGLTQFQRVYRKPQFTVTEKCHSCEILCLAENKLDNTVLSGGNNGKIKIWNKELQCVGSLRAHKRGVTSLLFDSYFLFSGGEDNMIVMWNMLTRTKLKVFDFHSGPISSIKFVPGIATMVSSSRDGTVNLWDYSTSTVMFSYTKSNFEFTAAVYDRERKNLFIGTSSGSILRVSLIEADSFQNEQNRQQSRETESDNEEDNNSDDIFHIDERLKQIEETEEFNTPRAVIQNKASYNLYRGKKEIEKELSDKKREDERTKRKIEKEWKEQEKKMPRGFMIRNK